MSIPSLHDLIIDVEAQFPAESSGLKLTNHQVTRLERIKQASTETANILITGIEAVGEMMGSAEGGEMSTESVVGIGWLLKELASLTRRLQEERNAAGYKLESMKSAPQKDEPANRGASAGGAQ
ncbi:hypothetical protein ACDH60_10335 [Pseudomonas ficuserectae]|uniref:Uncharacterized protein n=2 Tax=Pseudomonas amygdali pv. lachrymans TaxID=53707 RepID=A0AB37R2T1_PSEAV|nr:MULTISPECIES: hypothetical protein [Pseudomonas syringae group]ARA79604.1 hypothetical protein B5U27_05725 [Pseudomonas amygdali pv. lachrymans]AXH54870.1 hypothetical protein PLA107_005630 [Pseudomonas amygdali pv. lachrymans str. M301315]KKY57474.1 hypothetical protein AAY85_13240 [Pseudomonas amygdali pv. lachrymans]KPC01813.1 Uncharacterized protein AC501_3096 [Pseudomonas amygdali pv. lachrymans]KPC19958.1 Uncharacterized protein AC499_2426 [Pseudomonas amygdali pv. lachrymans]